MSKTNIRDLKNRFLLILIMILFSLWAVYQPNYFKMEADTIPLSSAAENLRMLFNVASSSDEDVKANWKKILIYTPFHASKKKFWKKIFARHINKECEECRCKIYTSKKEMLKADAVLFNGNDLFLKKQKLDVIPFVFPRNRTNEQVYVFLSFEPPTHLLFVNLSLYTNFFNWTMTYRTDSDVYLPYGLVSKKDKAAASLQRKSNSITEEEFKNKKIAIWLVSHCGTRSEREKFVDKLQNFIPVDVYGGCGSMNCGTSVAIGNVKPDDSIQCKTEIQQYIFYLALENSLCKDYVTEKMYLALTLGVIPVVMGEPDYAKYAPPNSYIDVRDFPSVEELAKYMIRVSKDVNLYNQYFAWKDSYNIEIGYPYKAFICGLCKKLHSQGGKRVHKTYQDISKWFVEDSSCHRWEEKKVSPANRTREMELLKQQQ